MCSLLLAISGSLSEFLLARSLEGTSKMESGIDTDGSLVNTDHGIKCHPDMQSEKCTETQVVCLHKKPRDWKPRDRKKPSGVSIMWRQVS